MALETCEIHIEKLKAGFLLGKDRCRFYAEAIGPKGRYNAAVSDEFDVYEDRLYLIEEFTERDKQFIKSVLDQLIIQLTSDGWQPLTVGRNWWNYRFQRQI